MMNKKLFDKFLSKLNEANFRPTKQYAVLMCFTKFNTITYKLSNLYDLNSRTYLMKLVGEILVILEPGVRCHITNYTREKSEIRSYFVSFFFFKFLYKLIANVEQLGRDRIIKFTFGAKQTLQLYLILEIYKNSINNKTLLGLTANLANTEEIFMVAYINSPIEKQRARIQNIGKFIYATMNIYQVITQSIVNVAARSFCLKDPLTSMLCDHILKFNQNWTNEEKMMAMQLKKNKFTSIWKCIELYETAFAKLAVNPSKEIFIRDISSRNDILKMVKESDDNDKDYILSDIKQIKKTNFRLQAKNLFLIYKQCKLGLEETPEILGKNFQLMNT
ncbi:hypothetical protein RFI_31565 [Reticulomyxa filosa]|uniref:Uncharacterized protein n=1 Tax=Reticulomyxa filosa TaxID=46433 RepID=X6LXG7_RETFI|nr:hypothetical protein RFI_31565 [Reticulomyxa filosa]|eukprot:ETO05832.1 hypothetical protein RFI_31565 [Reticulomyxa filosa]